MGRYEESQSGVGLVSQARLIYHDERRLELAAALLSETKPSVETSVLYGFGYVMFFYAISLFEVGDGS